MRVKTELVRAILSRINATVGMYGVGSLHANAHLIALDLLDARTRLAEAEAEIERLREGIRKAVEAGRDADRAAAGKYLQLGGDRAAAADIRNGAHDPMGANVRVHTITARILAAIDTDTDEEKS